MHEVYFICHGWVIAVLQHVRQQNIWRWFFQWHTHTHILGSLDRWLWHESWLRCLKTSYTQVTVPLEGCAVSSATEDSRVARGASDGAWNLQILAVPTKGTQDPQSSSSNSQCLSTASGAQDTSALKSVFYSGEVSHTHGIPWETNLTWE